MQDYPACYNKMETFMSDTKRALILLDRNTPAIDAIVYSDSLDIELTLAELRDDFAVVKLDEETGDIYLRDVESGESYNEYTLPRNHVLVYDAPNILIVPLNDLFDDYFPVADFTGEYDDNFDDTNDLINDLTLRIAKLEEVYKSLSSKSTRKTTKQGEPKQEAEQEQEQEPK